MNHDRVTLAAAAEFETTIRKSRFHADAAPITDADTAMAWIATINQPATHHCWAWRCGDAYRSSDDGEPSGSAGRPILAAIDGQGLDGVAVVVTRWFGGIKLGVGGLVRAYGGTAAECLRLAPKRRVTVWAALRLTCEAALLPILATRAASLGMQVDRRDFTGAEVALEVRVPRDQVTAFSALVRELSRGRGEVRRAD